MAKRLIFFFLWIFSCNPLFSTEISGQIIAQNDESKLDKAYNVTKETVFLENIIQQPTEETSDQQPTDQTSDQKDHSACRSYCFAVPESTCCPKATYAKNLCIVSSGALVSCGLTMDEIDTTDDLDSKRACLACLCCPLSTSAVLVAFPLCCIGTSVCCIGETTYESIACLINKIRGTKN